MEMITGDETLRRYKVGSLPTIYYIPDFITKAEEQRLTHMINSVPMSKWKSLKNRRLQNWGGIVHEKGLLPQSIPSWLTSLTEKICKSTGLFPSPINHVLINEYTPGQGIMPHQDGPAYFPVVAIISLGSPAVMKFTPHPMLNESPIDVKKDSHGSTPSVALLPRSLLIFKDSAYEEWLHGIDECTIHENDQIINNDIIVMNASEDSDAANLANDMQRKFIARSGTRLSLTCRLVPKIRKNLIKL